MFLFKTKWAGLVSYIWKIKKSWFAGEVAAVTDVQKKKKKSMDENDWQEKVPFHPLPAFVYEARQKHFEGQ